MRLAFVLVFLVAINCASTDCTISKNRSLLEKLPLEIISGAIFRWMNLDCLLKIYRATPAYKGRSILSRNQLIGLLVKQEYWILHDSDLYAMLDELPDIDDFSRPDIEIIFRAAKEDAYFGRGCGPYVPMLIVLKSKNLLLSEKVEKCRYLTQHAVIYNPLDRVKSLYDGFLEKDRHLRDKSSVMKVLSEESLERSIVDIVMDEILSFERQRRENMDYFFNPTQMKIRMNKMKEIFDSTLFDENAHPDCRRLIYCVTNQANRYRKVALTATPTTRINYLPLAPNIFPNYWPVSLPTVDPGILNNRDIVIAAQVGSISVLKYLLEVVKDERYLKMAHKKACTFEAYELISKKVTYPKIDLETFLDACSEFEGNTFLVRQFLSLINFDNLQAENVLRNSMYGRAVSIIEVLLDDGRFNPNIPSDSSESNPFLQAVRLSIRHYNMDLVNIFLKDPRTDPCIMNNWAIKFAFRNSAYEDELRPPYIEKLDYLSLDVKNKENEKFIFRRKNHNVRLRLAETLAVHPKFTLIGLNEPNMLVIRDFVKMQRINQLRFKYQSVSKMKERFKELLTRIYDPSNEIYVSIYFKELNYIPVNPLVLIKHFNSFMLLPDKSRIPFTAMMRILLVKVEEFRSSIVPYIRFIYTESPKMKEASRMDPLDSKFYFKLRINPVIQFVQALSEYPYIYRELIETAASNNDFIIFKCLLAKKNIKRPVNLFKLAYENLNYEVIKVILKDPSFLLSTFSIKKSMASVRNAGRDDILKLMLTDNRFKNAM